MSLRDQLLAKGLVSKKKAKQTDRALKSERRAAQGARKKKRELQREAEAARALEAEAAEQARRALAEAQRDRQAEVERPLRVRNLLLGNRMPLGRGQRFWHRTPHGTTIAETQVSSGLAQRLRSGDVALAWLAEHTGRSDATQGTVVAVPRRAAEAIRELQPEVVLFLVDDREGLAAPELGFHQRTWEPDLRARRATSADLRRAAESPD